MRRSLIIGPVLAVAALILPSPFAHAAPDGKALYMTRCASCHQANGQGIPKVFPPLAGAEIVNGPAAAHIRIVLRGHSGPMKVKGQMYNGMMPAFAGMMTDAEIAAVVTYERTAWGNKGGAVTAAQVKALR